MDGVVENGGGGCLGVDGGKGEGGDTFVYPCSCTPYLLGLHRLFLVHQETRRDTRRQEPHIIQHLRRKTAYPKNVPYSMIGSGISQQRTSVSFWICFSNGKARGDGFIYGLQIELAFESAGELVVCSGEAY